MLRVFFVFLALAVPASASAANIATPRMDAIASWAAGKPVTVHCEDDWVAWRALLDEVGLTYFVSGYTHPGADTVFLGPDVCERFALGANSFHFGASLHILLHEALHAQGVAAEDQAECLSLRLVRSAALRFYKLKPSKPLIRQIVRDATEASKRRSAAYQGVC